MEKQQHIVTEEQIIRYCEGIVSEEECSRIEEWLALSEENARLVQQYQALSLASDTIRINKMVDTEKALVKVNSRMTKNMLWWSYVQRIAAVLFIPLLLMYGLTFLQTDEQEIVEMIEVKTNPGMTTRLILPDGTVTHLNSETTIRYPSAFSKESRDVLIDGEAYFEVKASEKQNFIVSTPFDARIEVLGTQFNVEAYRDKPLVSVTLVEGKVNFLFKENSQYKRLAMQPGHRAVYDSVLSKTNLYKTSARSETAWKEGKIIFENTLFKEALNMLEKRYHVEFVVKSTRFDNDSFTGEFTTQRLDRILEYFKLSSNIYWRYLETNHEKEEKTKIEIY